MLRSITCLALLAPLALVQAQTPASTQLLAPPQNVLHLSASATAEVAQDLLTITLSVQREGSDAAAVQAQLKQVLDAALNEAREAVRPGQLEVRTGLFQLYPRHAPRGGIVAWHGRADLVIEGRDLAAISRLSGRLQGMVVAGVAHGLSRQARETAEAEVAAQAIARFVARAESYARQFGFQGYSIREVNVGQSGTSMPPPQPRMRALASAGAADEALPVELGKAQVSVNVGGSVQMSPR